MANGRSRTANGWCATRSCAPPGNEREVNVKTNNEKLGTVCPTGNSSPEPSQFDAALWLSGELYIEGAKILDDGGVSLTPEQAAKLAKLLKHLPEAAAHA